MPFGLSNAPATFQRALDILLSGYKWKHCLVYLDDVIIHSKSGGEHIHHVDEILTTLGNAGVSLKLKKCDRRDAFIAVGCLWQWRLLGYDGGCSRSSPLHESHTTTRPLLEV